MKGSALLAVAKILFGAGFTVAVACALGRWFLWRTGAWGHFTGLERPIFAFGAGAAWLSAAVFGICAAQLAYPEVFLVIGGAMLWGGLRAGAAPASASDTGTHRAVWLLAPVVAAYGYLYLVHSLAPEISPDGAGYHLGLVGRYLREHGFSRLTTHMYAVLSQGVEMLFLLAYAFGRHSAAKMVHFAFLIATLAAMIAFGRRFQLGPAAAVAAAFYACSPVVGVDGTSSYNDIALAFYAFVTFYLLLLWEERRENSLLAVIGLGAGFCYGIKYTGFVAVPVALGYVLWKVRPRLRPAATVALFASVSILPWMAKNLIVTGNPMAPFFNAILPNPYFHVSFERTYGYFMRHYGGLGEQNWQDYLQIPWELTVKGEKLPGLMGPLFLLAPLGLLALRRKAGRRIWLAAAIFALPWLANIGTRFLIPSMVFVSLALALAIWELPRRVAPALAAALVAAHAASSWPSVTARWNPRDIWRLQPPPWKASLRIESEVDYLRWTLREYNVAELIERTVPPGAKVFSPAAVSEAYTSREVLVSHHSALCEVLMDHLVAPARPGLSPIWSLRFEWPARDVGALRLVQTGSDSQQQWSIHELRVFSEDGYLTPQPTWLLRAKPNPWDAAMALDGNPATRWRSWWPLYPGMRFEVEFPEPLRLRAVELHGSADQHQAALRVEGRDSAGRWWILPAEQNRFDLAPPVRRMQRLATLELKEHGIDYLLTDVRGEGMNLIGPVIEKDPAGWGLREVGLYGPIRLYYIQ